MLNLLPHDPVPHGVDVITDHVAAKTVGFKERGASAHERIEDGKAGKIVGRIKRVPERFVYEFRKDQPAKQRPRPPRKPLMHGDNGTIVLLNLLLAQSKRGDERYVEFLFDGHSE